MTRISSTFGRGQRLGLRRNTPLVDIVPPRGALTLGSVGPNVTAVGSPIFFVAPNGLPTNGGQLGSPWDLQTALSGAGNAITPGSTVWLRGGTYANAFTSSLTGTPSAPIIVRQYPGERATLDGVGRTTPTLTVNGSDTWFWGFEITNSNPVPGGGVGINAFGPRVKFINMVIHDAAGTGLGFWAPAIGGEAYGCIIYNNGLADNLDHGIYTQNNAGGAKRIIDNVIFNNFAFGLHAYGSAAASLVGYTVDGNSIFTNGSIAFTGGARPSVLIGAGSPASGIVFTNQMIYQRPTGGNVLLGYDNTVVNQDIVCTGNYIVGGFPALRVWNWPAASFTNNTLSAQTLMLDFLGSTAGYTWTNQSYFSRDPAQAAWLYGGTAYSFAAWKSLTGLGNTDTATASPPTGTKIAVRPNLYESGRGHVTIYNWDGLVSVAVDVSSILTPGDQYEVRNIENVFGAPIMSGTYAGGALSFPMSAVTPPKPVSSIPVAPPATGPLYQVFLITKV